MDQDDGACDLSLPGLPELDQKRLVDFLQKQRWFAGKARSIQKIRLLAAAPLSSGRSTALLTLIEVGYKDGGDETYFVPLAVTSGEAGKMLARQSPDLVVTQLHTVGGIGVLHDGLIDDGVCRRLLELIEHQQQVVSSSSKTGDILLGVVSGSRTSQFAELRGGPGATEPIQTSGQDQSNSAVIFGERLFLKVFRKVESGINPDCEIARQLTEHTSFKRIPRLAGAIEVQSAGGRTVTVAMLQELVASDGNAWQAMLADVAESLRGAKPRAARGAELLGQRTAEMHLALAKPTEDEAFAPVQFSLDDSRELVARLRRGASAALNSLAQAQTKRAFEPTIAIQVAQLLESGPTLVERFASLLNEDPHATKIRIHGDYHLGQVLCQQNDFIILDFEGEPARPLAERRAKDSPLRDVAGMLRSFGYAAYAGLFASCEERPKELARLEPLAKAWQEQTSEAYLRGYCGTAEGGTFLPVNKGQLATLLDFFVVEKALYEVLYELNNRPTWLRIPLAGILAIATA